MCPTWLDRLDFTIVASPQNRFDQYQEAFEIAGRETVACATSAPLAQEETVEGDTLTMESGAMCATRPMCTTINCSPTLRNICTLFSYVQTAYCLKKKKRWLSKEGTLRNSSGRVDLFRLHCHYYNTVQLPQASVYTQHVK